jgi:hypothetical protein
MIRGSRQPRVASEITSQVASESEENALENIQPGRPPDDLCLIRDPVSVFVFTHPFLYYSPSLSLPPSSPKRTPRS